MSKSFLRNHGNYIRYRSPACLLLAEMMSANQSRLKTKVLGCFQLHGTSRSGQKIGVTSFKAVLSARFYVKFTLLLLHFSPSSRH